MKIVIKLSDMSGQAFLVDRLNSRSCGEIKRLVGKRRYSRAIVVALSGGGSVEEMPCGDGGVVKADLVITRHSAHWDLCRR
jgi:hypothetical protein